jgi:nucleoside-diphosphate-sugar epimerase
MTDTLTVGVLGTGIMGAGMARNLAGAGHTVRAWNRTRDKAEPLAADGVHIAGTPAGAVQGADVVLTMLYDGHAALDVMRQAAPALGPGTAWVQSTTAGIEATGELAAFAREHPCGRPSRHTLATTAVTRHDVRAGSPPARERRQGLRPRPPCWPIGTGSPDDFSGRHSGTETTPGSTSSKPSKYAAICATGRRK